MEINEQLDETVKVCHKYVKDFECSYEVTVIKSFFKKMSYMV